jgi:hypothetical protein
MRALANRMWVVILTLLIGPLLNAAPPKRIEINGNASHFTLENDIGQKTGFSEKGEVFRMIPNSDWSSRSDRAIEFGGPGHTVIINAPRPGTYTLSMAAALNWFGFMSFYTPIHETTPRVLTCNGRVLAGEIQTMSLIVTADDDDLRLECPYISLAAQKKQAGFYFEIDNPQFDGFIVENAQGQRFGNDAAHLKDYWEIPNITLAKTYTSSAQNHLGHGLAWGLVWAPEGSRHRIIFSKNYNGDPKSVNDKEVFNLRLTTWGPEGVIKSIKTTTHTIKWGEMISLDVN